MHLSIGICIYRIAKNRVHILPMKLELIPIIFHKIPVKNALDATFLKLHLKCWINMAEQQGFEPWQHFHALRDFEILFEPTKNGQFQAV